MIENTSRKILPQQPKSIVFKIQPTPLVLEGLFVVEYAFSSGTIFQDKITSLQNEPGNDPMHLAASIRERLPTIPDRYRFRLLCLLPRKLDQRRAVGAEGGKVFAGHRSDVPIKFDNDAIA
jgi:hypothetical protein